MLTTEQVAQRLGVKPATVYAYVSRGMLTSHRNADGKGSLFDESDVSRFAAGRSLTPPPIETGITLIRDGHLYYRGHDAAKLATTTPFESVVTLLWTGALPTPASRPSTSASPPPSAPAASRRRGSAATAPPERPVAYPPLIAPPELVELARAVTEPLPATARLTDRLRVATAAAAAGDPLRFDITPAAVILTGQALLATMALALPRRAAEPRASKRSYGLGSPPGVFAVDRDHPESLAARLWPRLTELESTSERLAALNAALILLADHDIAASTLAARVAASTRAHPYAVVSAGLAALDGPLHGAASGLAFDLLTDALKDNDPVRALAEYLRSGRPVPGFGHPLYPDGDPRAATLLGLILPDDPEPPGDPRLVVIRGVLEAMARRSGPQPNVDFALAALALRYEMPADAGEAIFAIARTAGWVAHALEEYGDRPLRFRPSGRYAGPDPK